MRILLSATTTAIFLRESKYLARVLSEVAEITVVAPERDRSGASSPLTLDRPLSLKRGALMASYHVNGTLTDYVHLAVTGMLDVLPDMVALINPAPIWATIRSIPEPWPRRLRVFC